MTRRRPRSRPRLAIARPALGSEHQLIAIYTINLASVQLARKEPKAAEALLRDGLRIRVLSPQLIPNRRRIFPEDDWSVGATKSLLGASLIALGRYSEAEAVLLEARRDLAAVSPPSRRDVRRDHHSPHRPLRRVGQARRGGSLPGAAPILTVARRAGPAHVGGSEQLVSADAYNVRAGRTICVHAADAVAPFRGRLANIQTLRAARRLQPRVGSPRQSRAHRPPHAPAASFPPSWNDCWRRYGSECESAVPHALPIERSAE